MVQHFSALKFLADNDCCLLFQVIVANMVGLSKIADLALNASALKTIRDMLKSIQAIISLDRTAQNPLILLKALLMFCMMIIR